MSCSRQLKKKTSNLRSCLSVSVEKRIVTWGSYHITSVLGGETVGEVGGGRGKGVKLKKGHNSSGGTILEGQICKSWGPDFQHV